MEATKILLKMSSVVYHIENLIGLTGALISPELKKHNTGGYLTIADRTSGQILVVVACGLDLKEQRENALKVSSKNIDILFKNKISKTSREANQGDDLFSPGTVVGVEGIYSFVGCNPDINEAIAIAAFYLIEPIISEHRNLLSSQSKALISRTQELLDFYVDKIGAKNAFVPIFLKTVKMDNLNQWLL